MHKLLPATVVLALVLSPRQGQTPDTARWEATAQRVTITRDDWGIAHIKGHTDADAVFGMIYAQAEDDFNRVEQNYLYSIGRLAEAEGEGEIWRDLRQKLFINPDTMKALYAASPAELKALMDAWADGLNYYLSKHPDVKPRVITRFEPWMALTFSEGSIGGDIERVNLNQLGSFYGNAAPATPDGGGDDFFREPSGSNGVAIAPSRSANHHAMLVINPHTSFFFRSELQMTSDEGLNAYGAVTWGQFFIYQGFSDKTGWMHTSSGVDAVDEYLETPVQHGTAWSYKYGAGEKPMTTAHITVPYKTASGMSEKKFTVYYTQHGPIVRKAGDKWVAFRIMNDPMHALTQSYSRTKARSIAEFSKSFALHTNSSNNTILADAQGNIAYFHGNYIPRRDTSFDWTQPVDGSNPATEYRGLLSVDETPKLLNPASGWLYNSNNWPWSAAGPNDSPKRASFPAYVEMGREESPRGYHALKVLPSRSDYTIPTLRDAMFDSFLPYFEQRLPTVLQAYDALPASDSLKAKLRDQVAVLKAWDDRWAANSIATSLAVFWGTEMMRSGGRRGRRGGAAEPMSPLAALAAASDKLQADFGTWRTPWGDINRFQRTNDDINGRFDDAAPSIPVPFTSSAWGSLASFGARQYPNTKKWYGTSGNSFVAVVEFGDSVHAIAVTAGGEDGHGGAKHFNDEAERYASGNLRTVYYYPNQLVGHTERVYHPGS
ncbi:MAG TPA: penicillin acylase family protein [Gemmatimonadales bacterium]|jgi:acyl-homoserine-lactone acylase